VDDVHTQSRAHYRNGYARPRHRYRAFPDQATTVTVADLRRMSTLVELYAAVVLLHHQHGRST
jgi:hypothetical protein